MDKTTNSKWKNLSFLCCSSVTCTRKGKSRWYALALVKITWYMDTYCGMTRQILTRFALLQSLTINNNFVEISIDGGKYWCKYWKSGMKGCRRDQSFFRTGYMPCPCKHENRRRVSINEGNFLTSWVTASYSTWTLVHGVSYFQCVVTAPYSVHYILALG